MVQLIWEVHYFSEGMDLKLDDWQLTSLGMSCRDGVPDITEIFLFFKIKLLLSLMEIEEKMQKMTTQRTEKVVDHQTIINRSEYFFLLQMEF